MRILCSHQYREVSVLFSSYAFLIFFLPCSFLLYFLASTVSSRTGILSLVALSSFFYAWHHPSYIFLIFGSILVNFYSASLILKHIKYRKIIFVADLFFNIFLIFLFKYYNFFISNINMTTGLKLSLLNTLLPVGISFFTFQQIGFIVSIYKKTEKLPGFLEYCSFITFFPQLIAGPVVKHSDYLPQLKNPSTFKLSAQNIAIGGTIFVIGLCKKVLLADNASSIADSVFFSLRSGETLNAIESWLGAISYSFQIYFDFSGYSDMAIGLSRVFNIKLPCNFLSPYQATSIIEFWRRWHISLSSFLREYIYIPLGGNRKGNLMRHGNLMITMLIGGLWHGASWTFVAWGGLHGLFLIVNHLLRQLIPKPIFSGKIINSIKIMGVFMLITFSWVFFRAGSITEALSVLGSMLNIQSLFLHNPSATMYSPFGLDMHFLPSGPLGSVLLKRTLLLCIIGSITVFFLPNVYDWLAYFKPAKGYHKPSYVQTNLFKKVAWKPTLATGFLILLLLTLAFGEVNSRNEFIYFQF